MRELNQKLSIISRVVVHPKYRTIGLGHKLMRETLEHAGTPYVKTVAVMAKYNPFFERAGMRKITESPPVKSALNVAGVLKALVLNIINFDELLAQIDNDNALTILGVTSQMLRGF